MSVLKEFIKKAAYAVAPAWLANVDGKWWAAKQARALRHQCHNSTRLDDVIGAVMTNAVFHPDQKQIEIKKLLEILRDNPPSRVCEIGARRGGTLILFAHVAAPDARIISLDIDYTPLQIKLNHYFTRARQELYALRADSHAASTLSQVQQWLAGQPLDFLFIDGDHSGAGVRRDFEMYAPLVRSGGIIAFHDIVADYKTRFGTPTRSNVGQVPAFWADLKTKGFHTEELIEDPDQDGMGIGIIRWQGTTGI
jgi:cephalosporin hydroxylase